MLSKILIFPILGLTLLHQIDAYWTVIEKSSIKHGAFWAELSEVHFDGNTTDIRCILDIQPPQDSYSITYQGHTDYFGCGNGPHVSLYGENRTLKYLRLLNSKKHYNCVVVERTARYKEYVCGNGVPNFAEHPSVSVSNGVPSSSLFDHVPTPGVRRCILGYLGKREGEGPNGACCTHSDDCLDTCIKGVCGVTP